jgi:hypothetical protein
VHLNSVWYQGSLVKVVIFPILMWGATSTAVHVSIASCKNSEFLAAKTSSLKLPVESCYRLLLFTEMVCGFTNMLQLHIAARCRVAGF